MGLGFLSQVSFCRFLSLHTLPKGQTNAGTTPRVSAEPLDHFPEMLYTITVQTRKHNYNEDHGAAPFILIPTRMTWSDDSRAAADGALLGRWDRTDTTSSSC